MAINKITEKTTSNALAADAHLLVTQTETVDSAEVHALRRVPVAAALQSANAFKLDASPTQLASGDDLATLPVGDYYCAGASASDGIANSPYRGSYRVLIAKRTPGSNYEDLIAWDNAGNLWCAARSSADSGQTLAWKKTWDPSDISNLLLNYNSGEILLNDNAVMYPGGDTTQAIKNWWELGAGIYFHISSSATVEDGTGLTWNQKIAAMGFPLAGTSPFRLFVFAYSTYRTQILIPLISGGSIWVGRIGNIGSSGITPVWAKVTHLDDLLGTPLYSSERTPMNANAFMYPNGDNTQTPLQWYQHDAGVYYHATNTTWNAVMTSAGYPSAKTGQLIVLSPNSANRIHVYIDNAGDIYRATAGYDANEGYSVQSEWVRLATAAELAGLLGTLPEDVAGLKAKFPDTGNLNVGTGNALTGSAANAQALGYGVTAGNTAAHAEGYQTEATGAESHAEGYRSKSTSMASHAEGRQTEATGPSSHAEGYTAKATAEQAHAEGNNTVASGNYSHAEGAGTVASGERAHAEGSNTVAGGARAHAEGWYTKASGHAQHVSGKFNVEDANNVYAEIIGNGTADSARSNARTLDWSGNEVLAGKLTLGAGPTAAMDAATKQYADAARAAALSDLLSDGSGGVNMLSNAFIFENGNEATGRVLQWYEHTEGAYYDVEDITNISVSLGNVSQIEQTNDQGTVVVREGGYSWTLAGYPDRLQRLYVVKLPGTPRYLHIGFAGRHIWVAMSKLVGGVYSRQIGWERMATKTELDALEARVAALEG